MQARNAHEVGHAGGAEDVPVGPVNCVLVTHDQRGNHARQLTLSHSLENGIPHPLAQALHRVAPGLRQPLRSDVARASPHVAGGLHALLPQP